jgi:hypothetical protein
MSEVNIISSLNEMLSATESISKSKQPMQYVLINPNIYQLYSETLKKASGYSSRAKRKIERYYPNINNETKESIDSLINKAKTLISKYKSKKDNAIMQDKTSKKKEISALKWNQIVFTQDPATKQRDIKDKTYDEILIIIKEFNSCMTEVLRNLKAKQ